jgi:hypothetical protein
MLKAGEVCFGWGGWRLGFGEGVGFGLDGFRWVDWVDWVLLSFIEFGWVDWFNWGDWGDWVD